MNAPSKLVLASASPRRRELLTEMGIEFSVVASTVDESLIAADHPRTFAIRAAYAKALDVARRCEPDTIVLAADTVVTRNLILYGKPRDAHEARRMLRALSGGAHDVITGVALATAGRQEVLLDSETTSVHFRDLNGRQIDDYIATGEPFDKAGAYGIQGAAADLIDEIFGDYFNVVGLPCGLVSEMLAKVTGEPAYNVPAPPDRWRDRRR